MDWWGEPVRGPGSALAMEGPSSPAQSTVGRIAHDTHIRRALIDGTWRGAGTVVVWTQTKVPGVWSGGGDEGPTACFNAVLGMVSSSTAPCRRRAPHCAPGTNRQASHKGVSEGVRVYVRASACVILVHTTPSPTQMSRLACVRGKALSSLTS